ncbi:MAG: pilus assembly protein PilM, partial [Phycisphaerae bacterium]
VNYHALEVPDAIAEKASPETDIVIREEIRRMLPPDDEHKESGDILTAHWCVPKANIKAPNVVGVMSTRSLLDDALGATRLAHLECLAVDCSAAALSRLGNVLRPNNKQEVWGILDIGYRQSRLVICMNDIPVLARSVGDGGHAWTRLIADDLSISEQSAEIQKKEHGLNIPRRKNDPDSSDGPNSEIGTMLFGILRSSLTAMATEVNRSYEYALSCYGHCEASDLILVGSGAQLKQLPSFLEDALGINVCRAEQYIDREDCRLQMEHQDAVQVGRYATALGLAIAE